MPETMMPATVGGLLGRMQVGGRLTSPYWSTRPMSCGGETGRLIAHLARASQGLRISTLHPMCANGEPRMYVWVRDKAGLNGALVRDGGSPCAMRHRRDHEGLGGQQLVVLASAAGMGGLRRKIPSSASEKSILSTRTVAKVAQPPQGAHR